MTIGAPSHLGSMAAGAAAAMMLLVVAISGCNRTEPSSVTMDLVAARSDAIVAVETAAIDFGTEQSRLNMGAGWYHDERNRSTGETFVWSRGSESEIDFHIGWLRHLEIEIFGWPFEYPGAPAQTIAFELNGRPVEPVVVVDESPIRIRLELPAGSQINGRNRLVARYGRVDSPAVRVEGSTDQRELAFAWADLRFVGVNGGDVSAESGRLTMPAGARMDVFPVLAPVSELVIDGCEPLGEGTTTVGFEIIGDADSQPEAFEIPCDGKPAAFPLGDRSGLSRLRMTSGSEPLDLLGGRILSFSSSDPDHPPDEQTQTKSFKGNVAEVSRPNVIIYLVDALRSDRLGAYGCPRGLSPRLDAMAEQGVVFTDMTAQSSWTKAAVASIFTGIWPRAHGVNGPDDRLPEHLPTIAERLHDAGYRTGAVVANAYVGRPFGFARGFDHFEYLEYGKGRSDVVGDRVESWLNTLDKTAPFFLYIHAIDPHAPYAPPDTFRERFAPDVEDSTVGRVEIVRGIVLGDVEPTAGLERDLRALYDAEVAANDASFGRLLDLLEADGRLEDTLVIFTSDHGEAFGEHGSWTHGLDLYNEVLAVPLVIRLPGGSEAGRRVTAPVQHIDLLPTILDQCGVEGLLTLPGSSLVTGDGLAAVGEDRTVLAYLDYWGKHGAAVIKDGWKLIDPLSAEFGEGRELYRHDVDPAETRDLAVDSPVRSGWLASQLAVALRTRGSSVATDVDPEIRKQLEALGYMQ